MGLLDEINKKKKKPAKPKVKKKKAVKKKPRTGTKKKAARKTTRKRKTRKRRTTRKARKKRISARWLFYRLRACTRKNKSKVLDAINRLSERKDDIAKWLKMPKNYSYMLRQVFNRMLDMEKFTFVLNAFMGREAAKPESKRDVSIARFSENIRSNRILRNAFRKTTARNAATKLLRQYFDFVSKSNASFKKERSHLVGFSPEAKLLMESSLYMRRWFFGNKGTHKMDIWKPKGFKEPKKKPGVKKTVPKAAKPVSRKTVPKLNPRQISARITTYVKAIKPSSLISLSVSKIYPVNSSFDSVFNLMLKDKKSLAKYKTFCMIKGKNSAIYKKLSRSLDTFHLSSGSPSVDRTVALNSVKSFLEQRIKTNAKFREDIKPLFKFFKVKTLPSGSNPKNIKILTGALMVYLWRMKNPGKKAGYWARSLKSKPARKVRRPKGSRLEI